MANHHHPGTKRVTRGGAQAVLEAAGGAGRIIRRKGVVQFGTPGDPDLKATIRPFSGSPFDGRHYCTTDWHVILVAEISGGDSSFSEQDAKNELDQVTLAFTLDGAVLPTKRTAIKRFLDPTSFVPEWDKAYYFQQGRVMSLDELAVGSHSVSFTEVILGEESQDGITFFIDPEGESACL
jgi:hypothetical protein